MDSGSSRQPLVMGRKASSTSAIDKLNKKKKKKKRTKNKEKRSSASTNSAPAVSGRARARKTRAVTSCPPHIDSLFPKIDSTKISNHDSNMEAVCDLFNENLRWLPLIANYSKNHPITSADAANQSVQDKLTESVRTLKEDSDDESQRMNVYKINRRKRYLAAQQRILDLYPAADPAASKKSASSASDYIAAAGDCEKPPRAVTTKPSSMTSSSSDVIVSSSDVMPSSASSNSYEKIEFAVPSALSSTSGGLGLAQKVI